MLNDESNNNDKTNKASSQSSSFVKIVRNEEKEDLINYKSRELIGNTKIIKKFIKLFFYFIRVIKISFLILNLKSKLDLNLCYA